MTALTSEDHDRIDELAAAGKTCNEISKTIGRHPATIQWYLYREGLKAPKSVEGPHRTHTRGDGVSVTRYTADEDVFIEAMRVQDFSHEKIAELSGKRFGIRRTAHSIRCRLIMLAAREGVE